jgi:hypothetical protein
MVESLCHSWGEPVMATTEPRTVDITAAPRVVITLAADLVHRVFGETSSACENAWQSVLEDRKRAAVRAELASVLRHAK